MNDTTLNDWPPFGMDPNLPAGFGGMFDPGNDEPNDIELSDKDEDQ